jgi:hypothetical protein
MSIDTLIAEIDAEITKLQQARALLAGAASPAPKKRGRPAGVVKAATKPAKKKKRNISPGGRARIAAAAMARWAAAKKAGKAAAAKPEKKPAATAKKRTLSAEARKRIADAHWK